MPIPARDRWILDEVEKDRAYQAAIQRYLRQLNKLEGLLSHADYMTVLLRLLGESKRERYGVRVEVYRGLRSLDRLQKAIDEVAEAVVLRLAP